MLTPFSGSAKLGCNFKKRKQPAMSKIIKVINSEATDNLSGMDNANLNSLIIHEMFETGLKNLTGSRSINAAWEKTIPDNS